MKEKVYAYLKELNIEFNVYNHPALYTCEDNDKYGLEFDGLLIKNLFLRNKNKNGYYLVSMPEDKSLSLNELALKLNESKLSFASEEDLLNKLKITPGTVSLLNIIEAEPDVIFIIDRDLMKTKRVCFHPNDNTVTITFRSECIERILLDFDASYKIIDI